MVIDARDKFAERTARYILGLSKEETLKRLEMFDKEQCALIVKHARRIAQLIRG